MRFVGFLVAVVLFWAPLAVADPGPRAWEQARRAVADLRGASFLPTECERAFSAFWRTFTADGRQGFVRWPGGPSVDPIFGFGNLEAADLLGPAIRICEKETRSPGDMVLRVLEEREIAKRARLREIERSARSVMGY